MIICTNCSRVCGDDERFCVACGTEIKKSKCCAFCGHPNDDDADFCVMCGRAFGKKCSRCGTVNNRENRFCFSCGNQLDESEKVIVTEVETTKETQETKTFESNAQETQENVEQQTIVIPPVKTLPVWPAIGLFLGAVIILLAVCVII